MYLYWRMNSLSHNLKDDILKAAGDPASKTVDWSARRAHKPVNDIYPKKDSYTLYLEKELNRHISMLRIARAHIRRLNKIIRTQLLDK